MRLQQSEGRTCLQAGRTVVCWHSAVRTQTRKCRVANFEPDVDHKHTSRENLVPRLDVVSPKALRSLREGKIGCIVRKFPAKLRYGK